MSSHTERTFPEAKEERRLLRPARGTAVLKRAMVKANVCITRSACRFGMSESLFRKYQEGRAQLGLHDIVDSATSDPDFFAALLGELAALQGKIVIDRNDDVSQADRLASVAKVAKEAGELVSAAVCAAASNDPAADLALVREGKEALAVIGAEVAAAERRQAKHVSDIARPHVVRRDVA
jgi:hypothetical protein